MKSGNVLSVMKWNDITKTKSFKFVGILPAVHKFALTDSNTIDQKTGYIIPKRDAIINHKEKNWWYRFGGLCPNTISSMKKKVIKLYQQKTESFIDFAICNKFII